MRRALVVVAAVLAVAAALVLVPLPATTPAPARFLGYVEAEAVLVGAEAGGRILEIAASEGDMVAAEAPLFALDAQAERAQVAEAKSRLASAKSRLADLRASQQRPEQIDVLQASRRRAQAALDLARRELERQRKLSARGVIAEARLEQAETVFERDRAALAEIEQEIKAARLAARKGRIQAAEAEVAAAEAVLRRAQAALDDKSVLVPHGGRVLDVFYRAGEVVTAGQPVVEILPPENLRVRFYVPEPELAGLAHGQRVSISCDGCPPDLAAEIVFIASEAEYTPPVIFSRDERSKLVFLIEAKPLEAYQALKPGLPVEVTPAEVEGRG